MTVRLVIELVGIDPQGSEVVAARVESDRFDLVHLDGLIRNCVMEALGQQPSTLGFHNMRDIKVAISLSVTQGEELRPALHLSRETIDVLSKAEVSLDFDPYV
jgi:hypothetical protein